MNDKTPNRLTIDIVSDVVCPWCIIGYKQLQRAIEAIQSSVDIQWHPFELNPQMPAEGQDFREHIAEKYGTSDAESARTRDHMTQLGAELGFIFNFNDNMRMHNTFSAHQLLHWASQFGKQHELKMALFAAHFTYQENLGDIQVLADIASSVDLDKAQAQAVLNDQRFAQQVRDEQRFWLQQGVQGVPATVINRRHLISGAQGEDGFITVLKALEGEAS